MLGLCCGETYGAMMNCNNGDADGNKDGNDDENTVSRSGSDGPIFDLIITPRYTEEDQARTATALRPRRTIYLCDALYI